MNPIEEKVKNLISLTNNFIYVEYYSHTQCDMFKINNEYTEYAKDKLVLCRVSESFEKALDLAIEQITIKKEKFHSEEISW